MKVKKRGVKEELGEKGTKKVAWFFFSFSFHNRTEIRRGNRWHEQAREHKGRTTYVVENSGTCTCILLIAVVSASFGR